MIYTAHTGVHPGTGVHLAAWCGAVISKSPPNPPYQILGWPYRYDITTVENVTIEKSYVIPTLENVTVDKSYDITTVENVTVDKTYVIRTIENVIVA